MRKFLKEMKVPEEERGRTCRRFPADMMNRIRAVKIVHDIIHRADYVFVSEFFRLMGIFVCENILDILTEEMEKTRAEEMTKFDFCIYVGKKTPNEEEYALLDTGEEAYEQALQRFQAGTVYFYDDIVSKAVGVIPQAIAWQEPVFRGFSATDQKKILFQLLKTLIIKDTSVLSDKNLLNQIQTLIDVYVNNNLALHSINLQYYPGLKSFAAENVQTAMENSYTMLDQFMRRGEEYDQIDSTIRSHYEYARIWCKVKANLASYYQNEESVFLIEKMAEECETLCREYPDFTNAWVLLGLSFETSRTKNNEALAAFQKALENISEQCLSSTVYYWVGKRYENNRNDRELMKYSYELANSKKKKFRNIFKLAVIEKNEGDFEAATRLFDEIIAGLRKKVKMGMADPVELEYLFKSYNQKGLMSFQRESYAKVVDLELKALEVRDKLLKDSPYFSIFYGSEAERYKELTRRRMGIKTTYLLLSESYRKLLDKEKAEEYFEKLKIWQLMNE